MFLRAILLLLSWLPWMRAQEAAPPWFTVTAATTQVPEASLDRTRRAAAHALAELTPHFPGLPRHPFAIVVHGDARTLPARAAAGHHPGSPGLALLGGHEIHVLWTEMNRSLTALSAVIKHEIVHELIDQLVEPHGLLVSRWLHEGLAQLLAGDTYLQAREDDLVWRVDTNRLLHFSQMERDFPRKAEELQLAYAQSYSYVAWLDRLLGRERLLAAVGAIDEDTSFERALVQATGKSTADLVDQWRYYVVHGSGARWRGALENCFSVLMILALPLLAMAMIRRMQAEQRARARLEQPSRFEHDDAWAGMDDGFYGPPAPPEWHHDRDRLR